MKPLVTQKIKFGVRLENDEIVGARKQMPWKRRRWWWFGGKRKQTHSQRSLRRPAYAASLLAVHPTPTAYSPIYFSNSIPYSISASITEKLI
jgi:hypothetical protein